MPSFTDQLSRIIHLDSRPERIVSLVPSQTELLATLGLENEVVGITKFCIHPEHWFRTRTRVGGTKTVNLEKVLGLRPDLIIANKEENVKEQIEALANKAAVWVSDVNTLQDAISMMQGIGEITGRVQQAGDLCRQVIAGFQTLEPVNSPAHALLRCAYLIWKDPYITVGGDTFINDMLKYCRLENVFSAASRYPQISFQELQAASCQVVLLSSEPYPFKEKHLEEIQTALPSARILLVDGEIFSWYGSRLLKAPGYFRHLKALLNMPV